jgi:phage-related protein
VANREVEQRWRFYATTSGNQPVKAFIADLTDADAAVVVAAMKDVTSNGMGIARHLDGDIYEVRASGKDQAYRVLFAAEGSKARVLLAIHALSKKTQRTPPQAIALAKRRLADWRRRARSPGLPTGSPTS